MAKTRYLNEMLRNARVTKVVVKIENDYSDEHHSESEVEVESPGCPGHPHEDDDGITSFCDGTCGNGLEDWWNEVVFEHTGDGHGVDGLGSCYTATIVAGPARLLGKTYEWIEWID